MKWLSITLLMIFASLSPIVSATEVYEETNHLSEYSIAVQSAFARCAELPAHDGTWLVVSQHPIGKETSLLPNAWLVEANPSKINLWLDSNRIEIACPEIERQQQPRWIPNDPKFGDQWHLENTGQTSGGLAGEDTNLTGAWASYQGTGVTIGIIDDGLDHDHPDLTTNYDSTNDYDFCGNDGNPSPSNWDAHGTAAAGVAAATGNNSVGVSGAAPDANLAGLLLIACSTPDSKEADALSHENQIIDIYSNSWGPYDDGVTLEAPGPLTIAAFEDDVANGRGGLGNIITWAAGNGLESDDDSNKDGYANARQTIAVTAIDHEGDQSYYAEPGANILVAAHSNGDGEAITTTDIEGSSGYTNNDYTDNFGGTSSATPLASGVIALILEVNANLTWRDVQHILVHSSRKNDPSDSSWGVNGAGHDVSHKYGYGAIDAGHAVALAENWSLVNPAINITSGTQSISTAIPDDTPQGLNDTVTINDGLQVEHVEVYVDIDHVYRGDLIITLTSPSGTESTLAQKHSDSGNNYRDWMFSTVHNWDEHSAGNWTLKVEDDGNGDTGTWNDWELVIHGIPMVLDSDGDGLTNENETDVYGTDPNDIDTDDDDLTDYEEVMVTNTDPLDSDSDNDTILDGAEVNLYGTNPLSNDTDGDGLTDAQEILFFGSNPLVFDADADADSWYWFQDCNDTNPFIHPGMSELLNGIDENCNNAWDEGFNVTDSDNDDLADYPEYHVYGTNWTNPDTDGDNLTDGDEVLIHGTDPLIPDADADVDGWYWFQDCNESDPWINPAMPEVLDGIDNDCDDLIDEDYVGLDSDMDGLLDLNEFNVYLTDPMDNDTDDDGLDDGFELNVTFTNPLVPDLDADGDGFRWYEDCEDNDSNIHPDAIEIWDGYDQNCNNLIDELVNRAGQISVLPADTEYTLNATTDSLFLQSFVNISDNSALEIQTSWKLKLSENWSVALSNESWLEIGPYDCEGVTGGHVAEICSYNGTTPTYDVTISISDGYEIITHTWSVRYTVWHPPEPEPEPEPEPQPNPDSSEPDGEEGNSTTSGGFSLEADTRVIIGLIAIVAVLGIAVLFTGRKKNPPPPMRPPPSGIPQMIGQNFR